MDIKFTCVARAQASKVLRRVTSRRYLPRMVLAALLVASPAFAGAPTTPAHVSIAASGGGSLVITWSHSIDADGVVVGYEMVKNGSAHWLGNVNWYRDTAVSQGITYAYSIVAVDNEGRRSGMSDTMTFRFSQSSNSGTETSSGGSISLGDVTTQAAECVDTDGDGWGWDGSKSCKTTQSSSSSSSSSTCIDEDGDGYGWDGYRTCLINDSSACVDTDGDGYGWDGHQTCIP